MRVILFLVLSIWLAACSHAPADSFGWIPSGNPEVDSVTAELEYAYQSSLPPDSLVEPTEKFLAATRSYSSFPPFNARCRFWEGRLLLRLGKEERGRAKIEEAIALTDSARYPYDLGRFRWSLVDYSEMPDRLEIYRNLIADEKFFKEKDAPALRAGTLSTLAWIMVEADLHHRALDYAMLSDSIFSTLGRRAEAGMGLARISNRLTAVRAFEQIGERGKAVALLKEMKDGEAAIPAEVRNIIDCNLWIMSGDTVSLLNVWDRECQSGSTSELRGFLAAVLLRIKMKEGRSLTDESEDRLAAIVRENMDLEEQADHRLFMRRVLADYLSVGGMSREATEHWNHYAAEAEENISNMQREEVAAADMSRRISLLEEKDTQSRMLQRERFLTAIAMLVIAALSIVLVLKFRLDKTRRSAEKRENELRRSQQATLAANLLVEERNRMIEGIEQRLVLLVRENKIQRGVADKMMASLRVEAAAWKESEEFARLFRELGPDFEKRLKERFPKVTKKSVRLASYIAMGMDSRHIARVMNIKIESVSQARWRLRQQMGITPEEDMDFILMSLLAE